MHEDFDDITFEDLSKFRKKEDAPEYPLVRIVGQQAMKKALMLLASNPDMGNMLLMGEEGIGKATAVRGLKDLLPDINVVTECAFNCNPDDDDELCPNCKKMKGEKGKLDVLTKPTPLSELPLGASDKIIFGGFDHKDVFKPGIIGKVNRGYLLVEKANLLESSILDRLLTLTETGVHKHTENDNEYVHAAKFVLIATLNPDDGELDEETIARFSVVINVKAIKDIEERIEIVRRVEAYKQDPKDFVTKSQREITAFKNRVQNSRGMIKRADLPKKVATAINKVLKEINQDNDWTKDALRQAALANAVFDDRLWVTLDDVAEVAEMVLGYRVET
jgi:magnesium chelatase subunit I